MNKTVPVNLDKMVNAFLSWPLPKDFSPDCGIKFDREVNIREGENITKVDRHDAPSGFWPVGTNLFTADQARQMIKHLLSAAPSVEQQDYLLRAIGELAMAMNNPCVHATGEQSIESATVREAAHRLARRFSSETIAWFDGDGTIVIRDDVIDAIRALHARLPDGGKGE